MFENYRHQNSFVAVDGRFQNSFGPDVIYEDELDYGQDTNTESNSAPKSEPKVILVNNGQKPKKDWTAILIAGGFAIALLIVIIKK